MNYPIDISNVTLRTERLILRPWTDNDLDDLFAYAKVDGVGQMAGWKPHEDKAESTMILSMFMEEKKTFALEYQGKVIGSLGIENYNEEHFPEFTDKKAREIGYVLAKDHWGMGLMPEAVKEACRYLFEEVGLDVIFCGHFLWNQQSQRVQEKCGFRQYAYDKFETRLGIIEDNEVNILTYDDWRNQNQHEETKGVRDFIVDGILAHGVEIGRFVFEEEHTVVYAISDYPHIGTSDVFMYYQLSKDDYETLLKKSLPDRIPDTDIPKSETDAYHKVFLCGESACGKRNRFSLPDLDLSLTETDK